MSSDLCNRRTEGRARTRLRSGWLVDAQGRPIAECLIHDRSPAGARVRAPRLPALPRQLALFDEADATIVPAERVWRRGDEVGLRFPQGGGRRASAGETRVLGNTFYVAARRPAGSER